MTDVLPRQIDSVADPSGGVGAAEGPDFADLPEVLKIESETSPQYLERSWHGAYRSLLLVSDATSIFTALSVSFLFRFQVMDTPVEYPASVLGLLIGAVWVLSLLACDAYEVRRVSSGPEEWQRVARAGALTAGLIVTGCFFLKQDVARGFLLIVFPVGIVLLAIGRLNVRRIVRSRRRSREWHHRVLAVGSLASVNHLVQTSVRAEHAGVLVVGACVHDSDIGVELEDGVRVVGRPDSASEQAASLGVDVVALAGPSLTATEIRELSWELEGSGRGLVMAHAVSDVASPRLHVSPLEGMPMVWVDQPQFAGPARRLKRIFDVSTAGLGLLLLSPLLAVVALLVRLTSRGPILFRQSRLGLDGQEFNVLKFRTMIDGAEAMRQDLLHHNESDGALFKMEADPRITALGAWLRRLSIDELPQLWNVLRGEMSLVGPRPIATIDSDYSGPARRRLLVRPGITGLWQVSGRSDLRWDDAVKLDLYYVENWSLGFDLTLIARTIAAVLLRKGAY
jgi:exopolysaccharide biosynthesis polyprenyl glycosylphosphotransferase